MTTKRVKDIKVGDRISLTYPQGVAEVRSVERSKLFRATGGCFKLDLKVISGPHTGEIIKDQHHPGNDEIVLAN